MGKMTLKWPKRTKNGPKGPNGLKCLEKWSNEASNTKTKLPDLKCGKIAKMTKNAQNYTKMAQNGPNKWQKEVIIFYFLGYLKAK